MAKHNKPRRGSLAFRPRKRSSTDMPRINAWPLSDQPKLLGFAGYKAGMTHVTYMDQSKSHFSGKERFSPVTVIEVPEMIVCGLRFLHNGQTVKDVYTDNKDILLQAGFNKRAQNPVAPSYPENFDEIYALAFVQPEKTGMSKKHVDKMMIRIGGAKEKAFEYGKTMIGKPVKISDVFNAGQYLDVISITKGKGYQGVVKRFGISTQRPKATKRVRHLGNLGPFKPGYVPFEVPHAGQMGYHKRTEYNKLVLKIGENPKDVNPVSGFSDYGLLKGGYLLLRGSVPGPKKRLIRLRLSIRKPDVTQGAQLVYISTEAQN